MGCWGKEEERREEQERGGNGKEPAFKMTAYGLGPHCITKKAIKATETEV